MNGHVFDDLTLDHVEFYVRDAATAATYFRDHYGFARQRNLVTTPRPGVLSVGVGRDRVRLVLTSAHGVDHPAAAYEHRHGDGVANIALGVQNAAGAFAEAVRRGATPVARPTEHDGIVSAAIVGFGDVLHSFVQRPVPVEGRGTPGGEGSSAGEAGLYAVDHFAVCLESGTLGSTVEFYERVLDFRMIFEERIVVGRQAMNSQVVQSRSGDVTLTLIEPDTSRDPGQIDEFLKNHGGPGVQHVAFVTDDIVDAVIGLRKRGVDFLSTPGSYYAQLPRRIELNRHRVPALRQLGVLVDEDHDGQLFQIFTKSTHPRNTIFFEVIERMGARTFGSGNIKALYEAVELERIERGL